MASETSTLKEASSRMEVMTMQLLDAGKAVPDVLVRPALDLLGDQKQIIYDLIGEAARGSSHLEEPSPDQLDKLCSLEAELGELVKSQFSELTDEGPWHNPPAMRRFRQYGEAISKNLSLLKQLRRELLAGGVSKEAATKPVAPSMAEGYGGLGASSRARDSSMSVEQALGMLLEKKDPVWKGSLVGIVHAAGVQELTPITSHSPGKFEFVFAPKSQAAWNLHCNSAMI
mmetsp:Transcript_76731/g.135344  ORF Transcript_76731/g.135344 Transcript_76731/m.135344 type:complete len:229 (+) Transcript_76731:106-792(+)|eukprot:CAMPEP_0197655728 /NCGR_PEP_ID=MMETSP1338-20131121/39632_1 /TAXON_ID=43686 ORGANISM="Pelagodinium beii, Strain RCC1491" /NCGR_SAMPLE_ID=MMETSP1338 /ASSEMBLY_ACC=CAM_ASM_000754 /LENGTH=228 /DNA_ID=CAMNT_0043231435 /DNA_START=71 /DNA_END=757 /DNA_ORIENTATION=-